MKTPHFFKPIFCNYVDKTFLLKYNSDIDLISFPQFTIKKEIKTKNDLQRELKKLDNFLNLLKIEIIDEDPFSESSIQTLEGKEKTYFFFVAQKADFKLISEEFTWMKAEEILENDAVAWWDQGVIRAYIPTPDLKN